MKKTLISLSVVILLVVAGMTAWTKTTNPVYTKLSSINVQDARSLYTALTPDEKREVWRAKLANINTDDLNELQIKFIKKTIKSLDTLSFDGTDDRKKTKTEYAEAAKLFEPAKLAEYFGRIGNTVGMQKVSAGCECSVGEDFCSSTSIPWHCEYGQCSGRLGCGWLWTGYCDGACFPG